MVMLRWALGVQILLVTVVQTCYSHTHRYTHAHTHIHINVKKQARLPGYSSQHITWHIKKKSIFISIQQPSVTDATVIVVIKI